MKIFQTTSQFKSHKKTIVTLGTFDGVHLGHQKVLQKVIQSARELDSESLVLTFYPHPQFILNPNSDIKLLNTIDEKCNLLDNLGLQNLVIQAFNQQFSEMEAEDFVKNILVDRFNVQKIIVGYDHRFGKNRAANFDDLVGFGKKYGFDVAQISAEQSNEISISSTKIRNAISNNDLDISRNYLGYDYFFSAKVIKGNQIGRTLGFPTANLKIDEAHKLLPKSGVFAVEIEFGSIVFNGIMNIGNRPTIEGKNQTVEVHIFDFEQDIYDKTLKIIFKSFIRNEQKFESLQALKIQLEHDKQEAQLFFS